ncbi:unnamed protein product [Pleuronectes platessa]|uniref:ODAD1 central coiled coil region domain-containing protein n=1 Tax=Pleuronectes platessa TaxID=8262 RepID=A0A9N7USS0_PLEPL|nr:unnamed protein product [Pleuronectes platessa]
MLKGEEQLMKEHIRKQELQIEHLLKEQEMLRDRLSTAFPLPRPDPALLKQCDNLDEKLGTEMQIHKDLEKEIVEIELKVEELRQKERDRPDMLNTRKCMDSAQVRLDCMKQDFNMQQVDCQVHRYELGEMHNEYLSFKDRMNNQRKELEEIRSRIEETIKQSTDADNAMLRYESNLKMMMEKQDDEVAKYINSMNYLDVEVRHQEKLKEFIAIKNKKRDTKVDVHKKKLMALKKDLESYEDYMVTLRGVHQEIIVVSGEDNVETALTKFDNEENRYFLLPPDVMHQEKEVLDLRTEIIEIQNKLDHPYPKDLPELDHSSVMSDLNKKLEEVQARTESHRRRKSAIIKFLDDLVPGVERACSILEIEPTGKGVMLDNHEKILHYLDVVEEKTTELLAIQYYRNTKDLDEDCKPSDSTKYLLGQDSEQLQQTTSCIQPIESGENDDSEDEWPLTREELIKQIKDEMHKERIAVEKAEAKASEAAPQEQKQMRDNEWAAETGNFAEGEQAKKKKQTKH